MKNIVIGFFICFLIIGTSLIPSIASDSKNISSLNKGNNNCFLDYPVEYWNNPFQENV